MKSRYFWTACIATLVFVFVLLAFFSQGTAVLLIALANIVVSATFVWLYSTDVWWTSWFGRSLVLLAVAVIANSAVVALRQTVGDFDGSHSLLIVSYGAIFLALALRTMVLWAVKVDEQHLNNEEF